MVPALLHSQFEVLEPPEEAFRVDITDSPSAMVAAIRNKLGL
jgi:hypothetical protein